MTNGPSVAITAATTKLNFTTAAADVAATKCYVTIKLMLASKFTAIATAWTTSRQRLPDLLHYANRLANGPRMRHFSTFWLDCWMI